jgi:hypothetical protein
MKTPFHNLLPSVYRPYAFPASKISGCRSYLYKQAFSAKLTDEFRDGSPSRDQDADLVATISKITENYF